MKKIKVGSLFSGAGAFEFALKYAGVNISTIFACDNGEIDIDIDYPKEIKKIKLMKEFKEQKEYVDNIYLSSTRKRNYMKEFYLKNHILDESNFFYDIKLFDGTKSPKIDLLVGGSPCQSFSTVGAQKGLEDTRGTLFYEYARILKETKPKYFIYENVKGLTTHDKGNTWTVMQNVFHELGYYFKYKVINSKNYGIPQTRNRIFVVGFKNKSEHDLFKFPDEVKLVHTMHDFLESNRPLGSIKRNKSGSLRFLKPLDKQVKVADRYFLTPGVKKYVMSSGTKTWHQKPVIDKDVARTILKTMGNHHRAGTDNYVKEFNDIRMLTEREAFRLMGFDDKVKINVSPARAYRLAGNSIVIDPLIKIFKNIKGLYAI